MATIHLLLVGRRVFGFLALRSVTWLLISSTACLPFSSQLAGRKGADERLPAERPFQKRDFFGIL
ncbi:MAG: hypothetical protein AB1508_16895 [Pseudomonadota bacterium]